MRGLYLLSVCIANEESSCCLYGKDHAGQNHSGQGVTVMAMMVVVLTVNTRIGNMNLDMNLDIVLSFGTYYFIKTVLGSDIKTNTLT